METELISRKLIQLLQEAYSGEMAAALAYRAHWKTVKNPQEKFQIQKIEKDEWVHRECVLKMLKFFKASPLMRKELKAWLIGRVLGSFCFLVGWFLPMYFAGWLERQNVNQYEKAAGYARALGLENFERELLEMERVEQEHEEFFFNTIKNHPWFGRMQRIIKWG